MANNFSNTNWVSMKILRLLLNRLVMAEAFNRDWEKDFKKEFAPGSSIQVKFPQQFITTDGMGYNPGAINRVTTTIYLDQWIQCSFEWDDYEAAVKAERSEKELEDNYFQPCAEAIQQDIDSRCALFAYQNTSMVVGQLGTDPSSVQTYYQARQQMEEAPCGPGKRWMNVSSSMMQTLGTAITSLFRPPDELDAMFKQGALGKLGGFDFFESNSLYSHTAGTFQSTVTVTGGGQSGTQIVITGSNGDVVNKGDKISFLNVNKVNRMTRRIVGPALNKRFTVTQTITLTGGNDTLSILPAIYGPGSQYQNVDALPANGAALTLWPGTTSPNGKAGTVALGINRYAFAIVGAKLYVPTAVEKSGSAQDPDTGIQVREVKFWDGVRSIQGHRRDSLIGFGALYQDAGAVAVAGA